MSTLKLPSTLYRVAEPMSVEMDGDKLLSISSDTPYLRMDWGGDLYYEMLDHGPDGFDDTRLKAGLPLLYNHDRNQHLGRAGGYINDGKKLALKPGDIKWASGQFASEKRADMESGALPDTSIGYSVESVERMSDIDGVPCYKCKWTLFEGSLVTIQADTTVGYGRAKSGEPNTPKEIAIKSLASNQESPAYAKQLAKSMSTEATTEAPETTETEHEAPAATATEATPEQRSAVIAEERGRVVEITKWAGEISKLRNINLAEAVSEHIEKGASLLEFKEFVLRNEFKAKPLATGGEEPQKDAAMSREAFSKLSPTDQANYCKNGGKLKD